MLKVLACIEDRDFRSNRELDRGVILRLAETEGERHGRRTPSRQDTGNSSVHQRQKFPPKIRC